MTPDAGHRMPEKAKIICPPPSEVDIITFELARMQHINFQEQAAHAGREFEWLVWDESKSALNIIFKRTKTLLNTF